MGNSDHGTTYMRVGGDDGELRPWHYIYVYSIESKPKPPPLSGNEVYYTACSLLVILKRMFSFKSFGSKAFSQEIKP